MGWGRSCFRTRGGRGIQHLPGDRSVGAKILGQEPAAGASVAMGRDAVEKQHGQSGGQSWAGPIANAQLCPGWNLLQEAKGSTHTSQAQAGIWAT